MAHPLIWYETGLPDVVIDQLIKDCRDNMDPLVSAKVGNIDAVAPNKVRKSEVSWIPTNYWIGGFIYSYVLHANRNNFKYDIENIEHDSIQYTKYGIEGHYDWHTDTSLDAWSINKGNNSLTNPETINDHLTNQCERVRKLSFSFQLSDPLSYEGGNFEIQTEMNYEKMVGSRTKGALIIFDSRYRHRVTKITKGKREALVGWVNGPRWR
mgnify:CR=1 FL=1|tara:strand:+ start:2251 stop:2880 length:630 start_codon:yes stop_codon:yes gene_type:complete